MYRVWVKDNTISKIIFSGGVIIVYRLFALISVIIRNLYLPNPFVDLQYGVYINYLMEPLLYAFTFSVVGVFYRRGELPVLGSVLYLLFYILHIGLLQLWNYIGISTASGVIILTVYISTLIFVKIKTSNTLFRF